MPRDNTPLDFLNEYLESKLVVFPLGFASLAKVPAVKTWKDTELSEEELLSYYTRGLPNNVALKLTANDGHHKFVDIDIDQDIGYYASLLLPETRTVFGRKGKWFSHFIYDVTDYPGILETFQFKDPFPYGEIGDSIQPIPKKQKEKVNGHDPDVIMEFRSGMHYVMIPPSIHENGEMLTYHTYDGDRSDFHYPEKVSYTELLERCRLIAGTIFLAHHWPGEGSRHFAALYTAGGLISGGIHIDIVNAIIKIICSIVGDTEEIADRMTAIQTSYERFEAGETIAGWGALSEIIGSTLVNYVRGMLYLTSVTATEAVSRLTDRGNALRMIQQFPNTFIYCAELKRFFLWSDTRWKTDIQNNIELIYKQTVDKMHVEASQIRNMEHRKKVSDYAHKSESNGKMVAAVNMLKTEPGVNIPATQLDTQLDYFNCANGTLHLETGSLISHDPSHFITQVCPFNYVPDAKCPKFLEFLDYIMEGNTNLVTYLQNMFGYCLTGHADLKAMHFLYGPTTDNGKTTLINIITQVLGSDYCGSIPHEVLVARKNAHSNELMWNLNHLRNKRLVVVTEPDKNSRLNMGKLKEFSGRNKQKVRRMHTDYDELSDYMQKFKMVFETNNMPLISSNEEASWNRVRVIPFNLRIPKEKQIPSFEDIIVQEEAEGILAWCVEGAKRYYENGMDVPPVVEVVIATQAERVSMDSLQDFIDECIEQNYAGPLGRVHRELVTVVRQAYYEWISKNDSEEEAYSKKEFEIEMSKKGFDIIMFAGNRYYKGIRVIKQNSMEIEFYGSLPTQPNEDEG